MSLANLVGETLNRYKIVSLLGEGGTGAVFKARDLTLQRDVAIKILYAQFARLRSSMGTLAQALNAATSTISLVSSTPSDVQGAISLNTQYQILTPDKSSKLLAIKTGRMTIGRESDNEIPVNDSKASRRHARVEADGTSYRIVDLDSTNGTYLTNARLLPAITEEWMPKNVLRIIDTKLHLLKNVKKKRKNPIWPPPILIILCCILIGVGGCINKNQVDILNTPIMLAKEETATPQMADTLTTQIQPGILYIYKTDFSTAQDYKSTIESNGFPVDLYTESNAVTADLTKYKLIIIGPDTGNFAALNTEPWGDPAGADAGYIDSANISVLGLWRGGGLFFKVRNQYINIDNCWSGRANDVLVLDQNFTIWNQPSKVAVGSGVIALYDEPTLFEAVYLPTPNSSIFTMGRQSNDAEHYSILMQSNKYVFWGYQGGPSLMTTKGKKAFINIVNYMINGLP